MPLPPYFYERPDRVAQRVLGASPPLRELLADEQYLSRAGELLEAAVREGKLVLPEDPLESVASYHAALALAGKSGHPRLIRSIVEASSAHARELFSRATVDELARYAGLLGVRLERSAERIPWTLGPGGRTAYLSLPYSMGLPEYLRLAAGAGGILSLPNSFLRGGKVYLDRARLEALLVRAVELRVKALVDRYRDMDLGRSVEEEALRAASRVEAGRSGLRWEAVPECIRRIVERGARSDEEAYMLIAFLASVKPARDDVAQALLRSGLATVRGVDNLADAVLGLRGAYPYRCDVPRGRRACPEGCGEGVLREYYSRARRGRRARA